MKNYHKNPRQITEKQFRDLGKSLEDFGDLSGIVHDLNSDEIIGGNMRGRVFNINDCEIEITHRNDEPDEQGTVAHGFVIWRGRRYAYRQVRWTPRQCEQANIQANKLGGGWDFDVLANEFDEADLLEWGFEDWELGGVGLDEDEPTDDNESLSLADRFGVPPFSVLDARQGYWQKRKSAWISLGIESELGRVPVVNDTSGQKPQKYAFQPPNGKYDYPVDQLQKSSGTSIFDPVICELAYTWFCPVDGHILDPFAGGSVRGIVASKLGRRYTGIDLRAEQIAANIEQAERIVPDMIPRWIVGNSLYDMPDDEFDFVFTCPPYYDLEVYSDLEGDLSNHDDYQSFLKDYRAIIEKAVSRLKDDRFACIVVGDIRSKKGHYRNFVSDTIAAFQDAGALLYNEAILVTAVGSLSIRAGRQFSSGRKLGKTHQNVLVFVKGDWRRAVKECGDIEIWTPEPELVEE